MRLPPHHLDVKQTELVNTDCQVGDNSRGIQPVYHGSAEIRAKCRILELAPTKSRRKGDLLEQSGRGWENNFFNEDVMTLHHDAISVDRVDRVTDLHVQRTVGALIEVLRTEVVLIDPVQHIRRGTESQGDGGSKRHCRGPW